MKITSRIAAVSIVVMMCPSCGPMTPDEQFVRQKIPIEIQSGKPVTIKIRSLSGNGWNEVGIRCVPDVWRTLLDDKSNIAVHLTYSNKGGTEISKVSPGDLGITWGGGGQTAILWPPESYHYLFSIGGRYRASASVEITFNRAPQGSTQAEIIVLKTPSDTGL